MDSPGTSDHGLYVYFGVGRIGNAVRYFQFLEDTCTEDFLQRSIVAQAHDALGLRPNWMDWAEWRGKL
jgi:hypothetical protein